MSTLFLGDDRVVQPRLDHAGAEMARLVNDARADLLASGTAVTIDMLAQAQRKEPATARQWVSRRRTSGAMITVLHDGTVLLPTFQLTDAFDADLAAAEIVQRLTARGMDGWAVWDWIEAPNTWLGGRTPKDALDSGLDGPLDRAITGLFQE